MRCHRDDDLVITETEWQAVLLGARALREIRDGLQSCGADELAEECDSNVAELEGLARRATVAAHRAPVRERAGLDREADAELEAER